MNKLYKLFRIHCHDLLVLQEMEWNGILFKTKEALEYARQLQQQIDIIVRDFNGLVGSSIVSISSGKHISCILYGGVIIEDVRVPIGYFKSGARKGEIRYKIQEIKHPFPRLVAPIDKTETALSAKKEENEHREYSVGEDVLRKLKATGDTKKIIECILKYRELEKLRGTYLQGYSDLITKMDWEDNMLHSSYNQCSVVTGRLSSTKPNAQNADKKTKQFMRTRYDLSGRC